MIVLGADTHKRSHTIAAVAAVTGELLGKQTVPVGRRGFGVLLRWARELDGERVWAFEDCRHVSGSLERFLIERGERVCPSAGGAVDDAEQRAHRKFGACVQPRPQLLPAPLVHADLAPSAALAAADQDRSAPVVEVVLCERERFLVAQAGAPQDDDHRSHAPAVTVVGSVAHDRHDLVHRRWVGRVSDPLCCAVAGQRDSRAASPASDGALRRLALTGRSCRPPRIGQQIQRCPTHPTEAGLPLALGNRASADSRAGAARRSVLVQSDSRCCRATDYRLCLNAAVLHDGPIESSGRWRMPTPRWTGGR
jgi:hypothetical protein